MPQAVLRTATTAASLSETLNITIPGSVNETTYLFMYFAELRRLKTNETREFIIYAGDGLFYGPYTPRFLKTEVIRTLPPGRAGGLTYYLQATGNSTLPPMINALEAFTAITKIKALYQVKRNWEGDPCVPQQFTWEGLECSVNASNHSRITSLNLSHSGLGGGIPPFIANLTNLISLQFYTLQSSPPFRDLSCNNFTGEIPTYIDKLQALKVLNLENNDLNGTIPKTLYKRSQDGSLLLRLASHL
ncbi:unnamed protein product [Spirodela intermedia]|uniref:Malectin-like domain-containing protein n=1 Tax=Spirodela intermedia TaxID=51605 RepID=A0A7I8KS83_SPIIN|nr:unnamed protein product [Spirodela intermedia]